MTKIEFTQDIDLDMGHGTTAMIKSGERFMVTITAENQGFPSSSCKLFATSICIFV